MITSFSGHSWLEVSIDRYCLPHAVALALKPLVEQELDRLGKVGELYRESGQ